MSLLKQKEPWPKFLAKVAVLVIVIGVLFIWIESRFRIGIDSQVIRCFPDHKFFLVDLKRTEPERDAIIAYRSQGLTPFFDDGTLMGKVIKGIPGDHLQINARGVFVNGEQLADGFPLLSRLNVTEQSLYRDEVIPEGRYFLMAPAPESYDGRYWGYINEDQIVGRATPFL
jgi:conjugal transfer pilin signal peptidase TrbI